MGFWGLQVKAGKEGEVNADEAQPAKNQRSRRLEEGSRRSAAREFGGAEGLKENESGGNAKLRHQLQNGCPGLGSPLSPTVTTAANGGAGAASGAGPPSPWQQEATGWGGTGRTGC